jgi:DNA end-binding protein Ku
MAGRGQSKFYLKLSLVTCPVVMAPAVGDGGKIRLHTLNRATGNRVEIRYLDAETGQPVAEADLVKAYQAEPDQLIQLEDDELDQLALDSTRTIDISRFVPDDAVDTVWYDQPHYLAPDGAVGQEAFSVILEAMRKSKVAGLARLVLYRRERAVLLRPFGRGMLLWTLRYNDEVRPPPPAFTDMPLSKIPAEQAHLMHDLIEQDTVKWNSSLLQDAVQTQLAAVIKGKQKGKPRVIKPSDTDRKPAGKVVNIMDALRDSLATEKRKRG